MRPPSQGLDVSLPSPQAGDQVWLGSNNDDDDDGGGRDGDLPPGAWGAVEAAHPPTQAVRSHAAWGGAEPWPPLHAFPGMPALPPMESVAPAEGPAGASEEQGPPPLEEDMPEEPQLASVSPSEDHGSMHGEQVKATPQKKRPLPLGEHGAACLGTLTPAVLDDAEALLQARPIVAVIAVFDDGSTSLSAEKVKMGEARAALAGVVLYADEAADDAAPVPAAEVSVPLASSEEPSQLHLRAWAVLVAALRPPERCLAIVPNAKRLLIAAADAAPAESVRAELAEAEMRRLMDPTILQWLGDPANASEDLARIAELHALGAHAVDESPGHFVWRACDFLYAALVRQRGGDKAMVNRLVGGEMVFVHLLARMEARGFTIDNGALRSAADTVYEAVSAAGNKARRLAGRPDLNVRSPSQVAAVLYDDMRLPQPRVKGRNGAKERCTDNISLEAILVDDGADASPAAKAFISAVINYRRLETLMSSFMTPLLHVGGHLRCSWRHTVADTGRLTCASPNIQCMPSRGYEDVGVCVRDVFVSSAPAGVLMSLDFSQLEVRVFALLSGDERLLAQLHTGTDIIRAVAVDLLGRADVDAVTDADRMTAKRLLYGCMYGMGIQRLAHDLRVSPAQAAALRGRLLDRFVKLKAYMLSVEAQVRQEGFVTTCAGRVRILHDARSTSDGARARARRQSINTAVQGSAADVVKAAMLRAERGLRAAGLDGQVLLVAQIHDELLFDVVSDRVVAKAAAVVAEAMESVTADANERLQLPLARLHVKVTVGRSWGSMVPLADWQGGGPGAAASDSGPP